MATTIFSSTELQRWDNVATIRNNVATILQRCVALNDGRCESCRVTSPLDVKVSPFLLSLETLFLSLNELYKGMGNRKGNRLHARQAKYFA